MNKVDLARPRVLAFQLEYIDLLIRVATYIKQRFGRHYHALYYYVLLYIILGMATVAN